MTSSTKFENDFINFFFVQKEEISVNVLNSLIDNNFLQLLCEWKRDNYRVSVTKNHIFDFQKIKTKLPDGQTIVLSVEQDEVISNYFLNIFVVAWVCMCVCMCKWV